MAVSTATIRIEHLQGAPPGTPATPPPQGFLSQVRFRSDDNDALDSTSPVYLPQDVHSVVNQDIVGSNIVQSVRVVKNLNLQLGEFYVLDPGTPSQEVVGLLAIASSLEAVSAIFKKNHTYGAYLQKVSASKSKTLRIKVLAAPLKNVTAFRLRRLKPLPAGVYDHFRIVETYSAATAVPWVSASGVSYDPVPIEYQVFDQASYTATGYVTRMVELQWLFTGSASKIDTTIYRIGFDEA